VSFLSDISPEGDWDKKLLLRSPRTALLRFNIDKFLVPGLGLTLFSVAARVILSGRTRRLSGLLLLPSAFRSVTILRKFTPASNENFLYLFTYMYLFSD
jgi:hypothetical protein